MPKKKKAKTIQVKHLNPKQRVKQVVIGPNLRFDFTGPGPFGIDENHLKYVSHLMEVVEETKEEKKKKEVTNGTVG